MSNSLGSSGGWGGLGLDPLDSLAHLPDSFSLLAFLDINSSSVLLALVPLSDVLSAIGPFESAVTVFLVILVVPDVSSAVTPGERAIALHFVVDPLAVIDSAVGPSVFSLAVDVVLEEIAVVC